MTVPNPDESVHLPSAVPDANPNRRLRLLTSLGVLILTCILYAPRLKDFFLSDDFSLLWTCIRPDGFFANNGWLTGSAESWTSAFRFMPASSLSGLLIYQFTGTDPLGWHLTNLLLHLINAVLVGVLLRRFLRSHWAAIGASALFAVHFIHAEPVIWISGRTSVLVTTFILAALVVESKPRGRTWGAARWAGLLLALLAYMTKEDAAVLPLLLWLVPTTSMTAFECLQKRPGWIRAELSELRVRAKALWPYWIMGGVYLVTRLGAIAQATSEAAYRIELSWNVIKNALFVCVANLFPLGFRTALEHWNKWYKSGELSAIPNFLLSHQGFVVGAVVAAIIWLTMILWGNRAARRLAIFMFVAAGPILLFRGTGERLVYLSSVGSAAAIAAVFAGWHVAFRETLGRPGRYIAAALVVILVVLNASWLRQKAANWETASQVSQTITSAARALAKDFPRGARIQVSGLPDNVDGAWVFRTSFQYAFAIYADRPDVTVIPTTEASALSPGELRRFRWDGGAFVPVD